MDRFPECGKPIDLDRGADLAIDAAKVPNNLAHLIPFVNKWSFDNLGDQDIFVARIKRSRPDEIDRLNAAFCDQARADIREWAASLPFDKHVDQFTEDDWKHPYWEFLNVVKLREATGGNEDSPAVQEMLLRFQDETRRERYAEATTNADIAFRNADYAQYVRLLSEYSDLLTDTQRKKLAIAARKSSP
jgi:hypothetical protein